MQLQEFERKIFRALQHSVGMDYVTSKSHDEGADIVGFQEHQTVCYRTV